MPPTGKSVDVTGIDIVRIEEGKAVERWGVLDALKLMQQLGQVPDA
jgi:predicted ester cyclase